jgi:histone-lysine N-methyltransferase SETD8
MCVLTLSGRRVVDKQVVEMAAGGQDTEDSSSSSSSEGEDSESEQPETEGEEALVISSDEAPPPAAKKAPPKKAPPKKAPPMKASQTKEVRGKFANPVNTRSFTPRSNRNFSVSHTCLLADGLVRYKITTSQRHPVLPQKLCEQCDDQSWGGLEIVEDLAEGRGVFLTRDADKDEVLCNYGGILLSYKVGLEMYDQKDFGNYLIQFYFHEKKFFFLHSEDTKDTYGKLINHSKLHPNCVPRVFTKEGQPSIIFLALRPITAGEELVYDYGRDYEGVFPCTTSCIKCKSGKPPPIPLSNYVFVLLIQQGTID